MASLSQMQEIPFTNGYYRSGRSVPFSAQRCINWRPNFARKSALSPSNLYMIEGIREATTVPEGPNRGAEVYDGKLYMVCGSKLYRIDQNIAPDLTETYSYVEIGSIGGTGRVIMVAGQLDLVIVVPDQVSYSYDGVTITSLDPLPNFRTARDVVHINSIFVFLESDSNIIFESDINDPTTYQALAFEQVFQIEEGNGLVKYRNQLYVMGDKLTVPFSYEPSLPVFSFIAQPYAEMDIGVRSPLSKTNIKQSVAILGGAENEEPGIFLFPQMQKISDESIDYAVQNLTDDELDNAFFVKHSQNDSNAVAFIGGDLCFVYDLNNDSWHERRSTVDENNLRWRVNSITRVYNRLIVGDYINGKVGILDDQEFTEYGNYIKRQVILQPFDNKGRPIIHSELLMFMDVGFDGSISVDWSSDGGITFNNALERNAGSTGEYGRRVEWNRLGSSPSFRVLRLTTTTTSKCNINKVYVR